MKRMVFLLLPLVLLLTGCMSRHVEEQLLVIVLGVDKTAEGDLTLTVKVPSNTSGEEGGAPSDEASRGGNQMGYLTLYATGHSFADALELLQATTPRFLNFSQAREVVISAEAARSSQCRQLLQQLYTLPRMHTQALVVVCEGEAKAFVEEQKPYVGARLSRYIEVSIQNYAGKGFVPITTLAHAVRDMGYGWKDPLLILGALPTETEGLPKAENVLDVDAGELQATSVNQVKLFGAAVTDGEKVCGTLTGYEAALVNLIRGDARSLNLPDENGYSLLLHARSPAGMWAGEVNGRVQLQVSMVCELHYYDTQPPDEEKIRQQLEQDMKSTLKKLQGLGSDALGFGGKMIRRFPTVDAWEAYRWREKYSRADIRVDVRLRLKKE